MFTLQILDDGKSFQMPLAGALTTVGSGSGADLALRSAGVAAQHARFEREGDALRVVALAPLKVNGKAVDSATLQIGDRIEIGGSYLVLGRALAAAAAEAPKAAPVVRAPRPSAPPARRSGLVLAAVGVGVLGIAAAALFTGDPQQTLRDEVAVARRLRETAKLDEATAKLDQLAQQWAGATDGREALLQAERDAIAAAAAATEALRQQVIDPADRRTYAQWMVELQRLERQGQPDQRIGARILRGNLRATYALKPKGAGAATADEPAEPTNVTAQVAADKPVAAPAPQLATGTAQPSAEPAATIEATRKTDTAEATKLAAQGLFAPALALLQASLGEQEDAAALRAVEARIADVKQQAKAAMDKQLAEAADEARRDAREAAKSLHAVRHRYPPGGEFALLDERIRAYETAASAPAGAPAGQPTATPAAVAATPAGAPTPAVGTGDLAAVRKLLDDVRQAEESGDFATAAQSLRASADAVRTRDAAYAGRLLARAEEATLFAAWHEAVADALAAGAKLEATLLTGGKAALKERDGARLVLAADGRRITWHDVAPEGVAAIADQIKASGDAALGASALLYRKAAAQPAEALLAKALKADAALKGAADRVIARGRGEELADGGYTLGKDGFTSARSAEIQKQAVAMRARLDGALRDRNTKARTDLWGEAMAAGPETMQALVVAMKRELLAQVGRFDKPSWRKDHEKLVAARQNLDAARQHARDLIYDEVKYFYPYKPPAVSSDRYAEYVRVQAEVNRRVDALRVVWNDGKLKLTVPGSVRADLERIDWIAARLADLGDGDDAALARVEWVRALTPGKTVGVQDVSLTAAEAAEAEEWRRVERYNEIAGRTLMSAQREQLKVTNAYRAMFRHRPLAIVPVICTAAQGHAEEMSKLGYFAHQSPTPGRTTPFDRMRLAGYDKGASENIALVDGAQGAHNAWCQSSGHHRNLLNAGHHEVGIGNDGRYWVQNFGGGQVYRESVAWDQAETAK